MRPTAQFLQEDLTAIGIDFQLNLADIAAYLEAVRAGEHNTSTVVGYPDRPQTAFPAHSITLPTLMVVQIATAIVVRKWTF